MIEQRRRGRALLRAIRKHRARLRVLHDQAIHRQRAREATCARKARYLSRAAALRHRTSATRDLEAYECPVCFGYHLGHERESAA